jgi:uncharacterized protein (TIGR00369 family)
MTNGSLRPPQRNMIAEGQERGFDDAWHEEWWDAMKEQGGNIIRSMRMRMVEVKDGRVVMSMQMSPRVRQGTGIFAAGALIQLADVGATSCCFEAMRPHYPPGEIPFPVSIQISTNLIRNTTGGSVFSETRLVHSGRNIMVAESTVRDEGGRTLCIVTSTHMPAPPPRP